MAMNGILLLCKPTGDDMNRYSYMDGYTKPSLATVYRIAVGALWTPKELWPFEKHKWRIMSYGSEMILIQLGERAPHHLSIKEFLDNYIPYE